MPTTSSKSAPVLVATKFNVMKLIERAGLMKIVATNSFLSITEAVLFVSSQTTLKSVRPRRPFTSLSRGSTLFTNSARVNSSLSSKREALANSPIAFSHDVNNLRTLIRSNADGLFICVLSP